MISIAIVGFCYKIIIAYFIVLFVSNIFGKRGIYDQIMYAIVIIPFVLRFLSIK